MKVKGRRRETEGRGLSFLLLQLHQREYISGFITECKQGSVRSVRINNLVEFRLSLLVKNLNQRKETGIGSGSAVQERRRSTFI